MAITLTTNYSVRCNTGRIPYYCYSIEYKEGISSQYIAKRGDYTIGDYKSQSEAYSAIEIDIAQYGATGIVIN